MVLYSLENNNLAILEFQAFVENIILLILSSIGSIPFFFFFELNNKT